jgi:hypothetical protein
MEAGHNGRIAVWVYIFVFAGSLWGQAARHKLTNTSDGTLAASVALGALTPSRTTSVSASQVQFRLRSRNNSGGYRLDASATFSVATTGAVSGGSTVSASDIGVGLSLSYSAGVSLPRVDTIASGFDYDPSTVAATNGLTPFQGAALGQATLADLITGVKLLSGPRFDNQINNNSEYGLVTLTLGLLPQYFTPATFSGVITLTISDGP